MQTRRDVLRTFTATGAGSLLAAFGLAGDAAAGAGETVRSTVPRAPADLVARPDGVSMVQDFGADLYHHLAATPGNLVCSPYSVLVALAMTRNGARGRTADEMDHVLHAPALVRLNRGLNAVQRLIASRAGYRGQNDDGSMARIILDVANSLWGQRGEEWRPGFLDALALDYGAGMQAVDYTKDPDRARTEINRWTSGRTHGRIPELFPPGSIDQSTRLVLANAVYFKAPWATPFHQESTRPGPFTRADGTRLTVPMMSAQVASAGYAEGAGWRAVRLPYKGEQLALAVVLPDEGRLTEVEHGLDGAATGRLLKSLAPSGVQVTMPKWTFRTGLDLTGTLAALGMPTAFTDAADFSAMTARERLQISRVVHQAFVAVDEEGAEAAAATGVAVQLTSATAVSNTFVVDRPFLFFIYDVETATPLFVGRVTDPGAA
jgi:serpin B